MGGGREGAREKSRPARNAIALENGVQAGDLSMRKAGKQEKRNGQTDWPSSHALSCFLAFLIHHPPSFVPKPHFGN
jgi:hypothetical protein